MTKNNNKLLISIIIPNFNGAKTLRQCLSAATSLCDEAFEVIVVDDGSQDNSVEIIQEFPCRLIQLEKQTGASCARNTGAENSRGKILFFTDSDCVVQTDVLSVIRKQIDVDNPEVLIGGTYTLHPFDERFFSHFQSVFINYSETKNPESPDYLATHALAINANTFLQSGGFKEDFLPILEDVEFSHRLRNLGKQLIIDPELLVQHIFNYSLMDSLRNATRKTKYWMVYSLRQHDLLADSGTASHGLKINTVCFYLTVLLILEQVLAQPEFGEHWSLIGAGLLVVFNITINRKLFYAFYNANGSLFALGASLYYLVAYPVAIGAGVISGLAGLLRPKENIKRKE